MSGNLQIQNLRFFVDSYLCLLSLNCFSISFISSQIFQEKILLFKSYYQVVAATNDYFSLSIHLMIIFTISRFIIYSTKCQRSVKNANHNFPEPIVMSLNSVFCPNNSPKHKDSSFFSHEWHKKAASPHIWRGKTSNSLYFFVWKMTETINRL